MIGRLTGRYVALEPPAALIDVGGVGWQVFAPAKTLARFDAAGDAPVTAIVETHVREDHIHLYAFAREVERGWFRLLLGVQGVGAKVALSILSALEAEQLHAAVVAQDRTALARADGVGPKLAQRIIAELKDRAPPLPVGRELRTALGAAAGDSAAAAVSVAAPIVIDTALADAASALVNLGFSRPEAEGAVVRVRQRLGGQAGVQQLIPEALRELAR